jgi:protein-disulfide isomerase
MMVLIVVMAFALGSLWSKVKYLEQGQSGGGGTGGGQAAAGGGQAAAKAPTGNVQAFLEKVKGYAAKAGMNGDKLVKCVQAGGKKSGVQADQQQGDKVGVQGTPGFFVNGKFLGGAFPIESFKELIDRELNGSGSTNYKDYKDSSLQQAGAQGVFNAVPKTMDIGKALVKGPAGAKVTIVEFSDFQCPYCQKGYQTVTQLLKDYNGRIKFVYKNFPLTQLHPYAEPAAEAFECAKDQGKGWEMHDLLFENQQEWSAI